MLAETRGSHITLRFQRPSITSYIAADTSTVFLFVELIYSQIMPGTAQKHQAVDRRRTGALLEDVSQSGQG